MSDLYDSDLLTWSGRQAALLRRVAGGEAPNEAPDWRNIIEEVESVGQSQVDAVESWLTLAWLHDLKIRAWPQSHEVPPWRAEARLFRRQARRKHRASMGQKLDMDSLYSDALAGLPETLNGHPPLPVSMACPMTLHELLAAA